MEIDRLTGGGGGGGGGDYSSQVSTNDIDLSRFQKLTLAFVEQVIERKRTEEGRGRKEEEEERF